MPPPAYGPTISSALRNWLLRSPRTLHMLARQPVRLGDDRRAAVAVPAVDRRAELAQRVEQRLDRPLAHAGHAVEDVAPVPQRQRRRQEARRRARGPDDRGPPPGPGNARRCPCTVKRVPPSCSDAASTAMPSARSAPAM